MEADIAWLLKEKYHGKKTGEFFVDCERLTAGEPLAYVIGTIPFCDAQIALTSRPLIPRAETEFWVADMRTQIKTKKPDAHALDLCAGSGCIGIAILKALPETHVDFAEIDVRHHATIQENLKLNGIEKSRAAVLGGDLFERITVTYDFILSNPPYIDPALDRTEASVREHEPHRALYGGEGGVEILKRIIRESPEHLTPTGTLVLEHEPEQSLAIQEEARDHGFLPITHLDQYGIERYTVLTRLAP